ncbi:MAG: LytR C-terminal domain-containing protein [Chitinispirillia bacterium]|jgi:hypothetical protein
MRNLLVFFSLCCIITGSIFIGVKRNTVLNQTYSDINFPSPSIPNIGRIEVLNGCGEPKAAAKVADFMREKQFDVKYIHNADSWNYPYTIIVSKISDMTLADKIGSILNTDRIILLRNEDDLYNISIFVGNDFGDLIQ